MWSKDVNVGQISNFDVIAKILFILDYTDILMSQIEIVNAVESNIIGFMAIVLRKRIFPYELISVYSKHSVPWKCKYMSLVRDPHPRAHSLTVNERLRVCPEVHETRIMLRLCRMFTSRSNKVTESTEIWVLEHTRPDYCGFLKSCRISIDPPLTTAGQRIKLEQRSHINGVLFFVVNFLGTQMS